MAGFFLHEIGSTIFKYTYLSLGNRTIISIIGNPRTAEMAALPVSPEVPENQNIKIREIVFMKNFVNKGTIVFTNNNYTIFLGFFQKIIIQFSNKGQSQIFEGQSRTVK